MTRKAKYWRQYIYPDVEARLFTACEHLRHDMYRVATWRGRIDSLRELFKCRKCGMVAWIEYAPPAGYTQAHGPALSIQCVKTMQRVSLEEFE